VRESVLKIRVHKLRMETEKNSASLSSRTATEHPSSRRRAAREEDWSGPDGRRFPESMETEARKTRARPAAAAQNPSAAEKYPDSGGAEP
jgi:hypothetical protein